MSRQQFIILNILAMFFIGCNNPQDVAVENFVKYADKLNLEYKSYFCNSWDDDDNGYISCSYVDKHDNVHQLECVSYIFYSFNEGCRIPKFNINM